MYGNYTIAFCDILGFRNLVNKNQLEPIISNNLGWFRKALHHSIHRAEFPGQIPSLRELQNQVNLGIVWFSDTVLLYTLQDTDECLQSLMSTIGWLIFETIYYPDTRIRCGVSYGEAYLDQENSIYVGKALIDAYNLEQQQAWCGAALTPTAVQRLPSEARSGKFPHWWTIPYDVPLKEEQQINTLAINWTWGIHHKRNFNFLPWSGSSPEPTETDWQTQPDVCEKWKNTKTFHDKVCSQCKPHNRGYTL